MYFLNFILCRKFQRGNVIGSEPKSATYFVFAMNESKEIET